MDIYFYFPEAFDEHKIILNSFKEMILFSKKNHSINIYYSEENIIEFKKLNAETGIYLLDDLKIFRQFLGSSRAIKIKSITSNIVYVRWNLNEFKTFSCEKILVNIAENIYQNPTYHYLLLNISNAIEACRNQILIFRDNQFLNYPDHFVKIDYVVDEIEFKEWFKTAKVKTFSLKNEEKFQKKANVIVKGATVYMEKYSNRYWHLDTLHEYIEYEIYDSDGLHIGVANENGIINYGGKKPGRKIKL